MNAKYDSFRSTKITDIVAQMDALQDDIFSLSNWVSQLSALSEEQLLSLDIEYQVCSVQHSIKQFIALSSKLPPLLAEPDFIEIEYVEPWDEYEPSKTQITGIRKDIKHFNKLANPLNLTHTKGQVGMDGKKRESGLPKELTQKSEYLCRAMQNIASKQSSF